MDMAKLKFYVWLAIKTTKSLDPLTLYNLFQTGLNFDILVFWPCPPFFFLWYPTANRLINNLSVHIAFLLKKKKKVGSQKKKKVVDEWYTLPFTTDVVISLILICVYLRTMPFAPIMIANLATSIQYPTLEVTPKLMFI